MKKRLSTKQKTIILVVVIILLLLIPNILVYTSIE